MHPREKIKNLNHETPRSQSKYLPYKSCCEAAHMPVLQRYNAHALWCIYIYRKQQRQLYNISSINAPSPTSGKETQRKNRAVHQRSTKHFKGVKPLHLPQYMKWKAYVYDKYPHPDQNLITCRGLLWSASPKMR